MSFFHRLSLLVLGVQMVSSFLWATPESSQFEITDAQRSQYGEIASVVANILEQTHFTRKKLDEKVSQEFFENYLRALDPNRLYLLQSDVEELRQKYGQTLHLALSRRDITPALAIYQRYAERVEARLNQVEKLLQKDFAFDSHQTVEINRTKANWPKNQAEADLLWRKRIEGEFLGEQLNTARLDPPRKVLQRRYDQIRRSLREQEPGDVVRTYLNALAETYDPHSNYLSPEEMENFAISMRLSLVGVGAVLRSDEGYARVVEIVPGGPADRDGRLKVNDRIAAVAQGDGEFEDTVGLKLDRVVQKIRGEKGTKVRLMVIPAQATDVAETKIIEIIRDQVHLRDQEAKAELIELPAPGKQTPTRIGWITLPSFYSSNVDPRGDGGRRKSTTDDVAQLLHRLTQEGIDGLIIDLRRDGGGSLEEAINLTGLFIPEGPIVQVKDTNGRVNVQADTNGRTLYNGPMIVLMNRLSASASEIFAAALQDYGRALIVGDERSFGKGTVQQVIEVGRFLPFFSRAAENAGSLKLTVQKFYRVKGGSTQLHGVESDIVLPSPTDTAEIGEGALNNPMEYDEVDPRLIKPWPVSPVAFLPELRRRSAQRVQNEPEFQFIMEDMARLRERLASNQLSLNKKVREAEVQAQKERQEARNEFRKQRGPALPAVAYEITLDNVQKPELVKVAFDRANEKVSREVEDPALSASEDLTSSEQDKKDEPVVPDAIRNEALLIMQDLVELSSASRTALKNEGS